MGAPLSYYNQISNMMYGFGDSHIPNPDTVNLVENITLNQLRLIVEEAIKVQTICKHPDSPTEEKKTLTAKEFVFLMRKNKYKMRRFVKYLHSKAQQKDLQSTFTQEVPVKPQSIKNELIDFIEYIDETGELTDLTEYDEVKYERMVRADRISMALSDEAYLKFYKARCTSFKLKNMTQIHRLKQWIDPGNTVNFTDDAMDVISYFAYETVAYLIDYALLVRMDHNRKADPLANLQGMHYSADMFNSEQFSGSNPDYSRVYSGQQPISVSEIKEVMRRLFTPQAGFCLLGKKLPPSRSIIVI